jgi:hypothetical protein
MLLVSWDGLGEGASLTRGTDEPNLLSIRLYVQVNTPLYSATAVMTASFLGFVVVTIYCTVSLLVLLRQDPPAPFHSNPTCAATRQTASHGAWRRTYAALHTHLLPSAPNHILACCQLMRSYAIMPSCHHVDMPHAAPPTTTSPTVARNSGC